MFAAFDTSRIAAQNTDALPSSPSLTFSCPVSPTTFAGWFHNKSVAVNGLVDPADSLNFPNTPNCSFYEWSEHMFLWLTSPFNGTANGRKVFRTATFFDVSPPDINTVGRPRTFIRAPVSGVLNVEQGQADGRSTVLQAQATARVRWFTT